MKCKQQKGADITNFENVVVKIKKLEKCDIPTKITPSVQHIPRKLQLNDDADADVDVGSDSDESTWYDAGEHMDIMLYHFDKAHTQFMKAYEEAVIIRSNIDYDRKVRRTEAEKKKRAKMASKEDFKDIERVQKNAIC